MMENDRILNEARKNSLVVTLRKLEERSLILELLMTQNRLERYMCSFSMDIIASEAQPMRRFGDRPLAFSRPVSENGEPLNCDTATTMDFPALALLYIWRKVLRKRFYR